MENGLISKNPYRFMPVCSRADLPRPDLQAFLRRHHKRPHSLFCACGAELGLEFPLVVREEDGLCCIAREDIDEHLLGCFLRRPGDAFAREPVRTSRIFEAPFVAIPLSRATNPAHWDGAFAVHEDFTAYVRRLLSWGVAKAVLAVNAPRLATGRPLTLPATLDVFRGIDAVIRQLGFRDAENGYVAAQHTGARLRFGLMFDAVNADALPLPASVTWWHNGFFEHSLVMLPREAVLPALADLQVFLNVQAAPYLVVAVVEPDGVVRRIFLHQVLLAAQKLVLVESDYEARFASWLIRNGRVFLKPVREDEIDRVLAELGFDDGADGRWSHRPDFFVLGSPAGRSLEIVEVRGFKPGENAAYDARLAAKALHYDGLCRARGWSYRCVDGWTLPPARQSGYSELFSAQNSVYEAPPAAVLALCSDAVEALKR